MTETERALREHLVRALEWAEAHVDFAKATTGIPAGRRGERAAGLPHSPWDLVEHMRIAQRDLLDFCVNPHYTHDMTWPDDYWPREKDPSDEAWRASLAGFETDRAALQRLAGDASIDLSTRVPTGADGQTYLRSLLLTIDHTAYHLGQLIDVRQALGIWP